MTLRRRSPKRVAETAAEPLSAWRRIEIEGVSRSYRTPRILDCRIALDDHEGPIGQLTIADLGHEEPTLLLTNQLHRSARDLIRHQAQRMAIENSIAGGINFFHMDALSSTVPMKVDCDLQLTLLASSLYRILGRRAGNGYETARSSHIFRDLIDATAQVTITAREFQVRFQKRAHNPLLLAAGFDQSDLPVSWLDGKRLRPAFGWSLARQVTYMAWESRLAERRYLTAHQRRPRNPLAPHHRAERGSKGTATPTGSQPAGALRTRREM